MVLAGPPAGTTLTFRSGLRLPHDSGVAVVRQDVSAAVGSTRHIAAGNPAAANSRPDPGHEQLEPGARGRTRADKSFGPDPSTDEFRRAGALTSLPLNQPTYADYPPGTSVRRVSIGAATATVNLTRDAVIGDTVIGVDNRVGFVNNALIQVGVGAQAEIRPGRWESATAPSPNAGNLALRGPLRFAHPIVGTTVQLLPAPTTPTRDAVVTLGVAEDESVEFPHQPFRVLRDVGESVSRHPREARISTRWPQVGSAPVTPMAVVDPDSAGAGPCGGRLRGAPRSLRRCASHRRRAVGRWSPGRDGAAGPAAPGPLVSARSSLAAGSGSTPRPASQAGTNW